MLRDVIKERNMWKDFWHKLFEPKAFNQGFLPEADGHKVFFAEYGNPKGKVVLLTHGGPGGRTSAGHAKIFDLKKYRVIMFDQRGCGLSEPKGEMKHNSMEDIIWDIKRLYDYLNLSGKVILRGASWGSTVMLCFAERYPELVDKLLLSQVFLADEVHSEWFDKQSALFYPEFLEQMQENAGSWKSLPEYYAELINADDLQKNLTAANQYGWYERILGNVHPAFGTKEILDDDEYAELKIYLNYAAKAYTLKNNQIMRNVKKIQNIPALLIHNRLDMDCPLYSVWQLHKNMPLSKLKIAPGIGHYNPLLKKFIAREIRAYLAEND